MLAALFSFVAMRAAFDARDEARIAGELASTGEDVGPDVRELHDPLLRAGLIEDTTGRFDYLSSARNFRRTTKPTDLVAIGSWLDAVMTSG
jgi:hypothetical protein